MGEREMGRYWSSEEERKISTLREKQRLEKEISERMSSSQKASAVKRKRAAGNPGGKPTNVSTFTKRKKVSMGGLI